MTAEAQILNDVMAALIEFQPDIMYWRNNTGALKTADQRFVRFGQVGSPDILACYKGMAIGIECKSSKGRQSKEQLEWMRRWGLAGGAYFLIGSQGDIDYMKERIRHMVARY
jgi:hypothetical protein